MATKIKVGIVGGAGYTGGELIRILLNHPDAEIIFVHSKSNAGNFLYQVHKDLLGDTEIKFSSVLNNKIDVLFLCVGHGDAVKFLAENEIDASIRIIDLSQDFRLGETVNKRKFVYGLPELNKAQIKKAKNIANPGCFATAIQLGLLPLAKAGLLKEINTTGITGSTGAGQGFSETSHFSWRANNIQAYKTLSHQHLKEIGQSMLQLNPEANVDLNFIPWRGDFTRGIFISSQIKCALELKEVSALYKKYYAAHPFVVLSDEPVFLKQVVNTNKCFIQLEKIGSNLVIHSVIDNLLKGASGQAVQNMNLMFGLEETTGLKLKANYF
ncbi:MAG: N-acetyl-gamma-glutamyl-phosphate reductase [Chitinophagaceae bacterium]|nr:N-acetyl-gamma-glutamyl-phosphate reductase [Chitinophagaceae bacterium]